MKLRKFYKLVFGIKYICKYVYNIIILIFNNCGVCGYFVCDNNKRFMNIGVLILINVGLVLFNCWLIWFLVFKW